MDHLVIFGHAHCARIGKIQAAAKLCGVSTCVKAPENLSRESLQIPRFPTICTPLGLIEGSNSALRYLAAAYPVRELYGTSLAEKLAIDSALDGITAEFEVPFCAVKKGGDAAKIGEEMMKTLTHMEGNVSTKTFLVGNRMSIADIAFAFAVKNAVSKKLIPGFNKLVNLVRICNTVFGRTETDFSIDFEAADAPATAKPAAKLAPKKEEEKKPAEAPKVRDPIEDLAPTEFDMDAWKRKYSNSKDLKGDAMPYLWEKLDAAGFSFWHFKYQRYNDQDNTKVFMASNLLGMFLQRIDNWLRKYSFGVCEVFEQEGYFDIEGVIMVRGLEIPVKLRDHDQFDSFTWTKLDQTKSEDKQLITDYFCEEDAIQGKKIADSKVYK